VSKPAGKSVAGLHRLAEIYGIQTAYTDVLEKRRVANAEALFAVLQAMGAQFTNDGHPTALAAAASDESTDG
jgi:hypothetical protein